MTDSRGDDSTGKQGQPAIEQAEPTSGAGYGDHTEEPEKSDENGGGQEKSA